MECTQGMEHMSLVRHSHAFPEGRRCPACQGQFRTCSHHRAQWVPRRHAGQCCHLTAMIQGCLRQGIMLMSTGVMSPTGMTPEGPLMGRRQTGDRETEIVSAETKTEIGIETEIETETEIEAGIGTGTGIGTEIETGKETIAQEQQHLFVGRLPTLCSSQGSQVHLAACQAIQLRTIASQCILQGKLLWAHPGLRPAIGWVHTQVLQGPDLPVARRLVAGTLQTQAPCHLRHQVKHLGPKHQEPLLLACPR